jgi:hypothetical protein
MRHVISLGGNCRIAHNLRRVLDLKTAYPFDWWVSPLAGAIQFLNAPDLEKLYDPEALEAVRHNGGIFTVRNTIYGIGLHHEFPRDAKGLVQEDFRDFVEKPKARTRHLLDRLRELNSADNDIVCVRNAASNDRSEDIPVFLDAARAFFGRARQLPVLQLWRAHPVRLAKYRRGRPAGGRLDGRSGTLGRRAGQGGVAAGQHGVVTPCIPDGGRT